MTKNRMYRELYKENCAFSIGSRVGTFVCNHIAIAYPQDYTYKQFVDLMNGKEVIAEVDQDTGDKYYEFFEEFC